MKKVFLFLTMFLFAFTGVTRANVQQNRADQVIEQGFEDGLGDWTMNNCHSSSGPTSSYGGNTGNYAFRFYYTANYPQYLISPELDDNDGVNFTFYAARYSSNYPETFKVGYSSTTNDPTEFTWGSEVTCTTMYGAGEYEEYSYDFPAGTKYVAIACTSNDQFYLFVDDITVTATEPAPAPTPGGLVEVTIGDPTSTTTNSYLPGYTLYDYAISQQIYTADEIGVAGTINTLTVWLKNTSSYARNLNVYMKEVEATEFASTSAWESFAAADMVASFTMPNGIDTPIEVALPLNTPFEYSGNSSLVICFQDVTGQWSSGLGGVEMAANGNQSLYAYRDGTVYDPSNPDVNGTLLAKKNVIKLSIMTGGGEPTTFATVPNVLDLGYRPNGAWMAPYVFNLKSNVGAVTVNALDFSGNYFTYNAELPATVSGNNPLEVAVSTGTAAEGLVESTMTIMYSGNRDIEQHPVTAYAYDPVDGDVWEKAINVTSFPYNDNAPAGIYKNYDLPEATEGADAMYKVTFNNDVMFSAGTAGENAVTAIYPEGFNGQPGPMVDNNYVYNGPTVNPGPTSLWFNYSYTGTNTWYGTSAGGGTIFGYKITPEQLQELGLGNCAIATVETAARNATTYEFYDLMLLKGGDTPDLNNMVYYQEFSDFTPGYYFDVNLDEPQFLGDDENIWVMFYSDAPYAAYCGRYPVDTNNGKIWYTTNLSTWYSSTTYTPVIYTRFLELPTGREVTVNLADMKIRESKPAAGELAEANGDVMGISKAQMQKANRTVETYQIEDLYVPAGTYYVAVASTTEEFNVDMAVAEVPAPEQAYVIYPYDGETNVTTPYLAEWVLGDYTEEMQVLLGTQYPPQTVMIDWTDYLVESAFLPELEPNQSYFMQVNERNASGTTYGEIIAFTTPIDGVTGFAVENEELYPGETAVFTWDANRSFKGYNLYMSDGNGIVKVNESLITTNTYEVEGLEYNMDGYYFAVTAVYDAGESDYSDVVVVYMTGNGTVSGHAYDKPDEDTDAQPIAFALVEFRGTDEYGEEQSFVLTADEEGAFTGEILAGNYVAAVITDGYDNTEYVENIVVNYNELTDNIDIYTHEFYYPLEQITATEQEDNTVLVEWSWTPGELIVDFETGDFSQANFTLPVSYPWAITTTNPHEGTYAMKSTCEGIASGTSEIEVTVDVPYDGKMGFWVRVSSEASYDKFHFFIDGIEKGAAISGQQAYAYKEFDVTEGTHTYKWQYAKDSSVNSNDDCVYVDDITLYRYEAPLPPVVGATTYDFEDGTMQGWTTIDANNDGYDWVMGSQIGGVYLVSGASLAGSGHESSNDLVCSGSYSNAASSAITPDNYLVSPQISAENGAQIRFWACGQDASYPAEHFGVAVSTTNNTSASAFSTIQEWTMTAKSGRGANAEAADYVRGSRAQGAWYEYTVDLSAYAGQDIYVAIRHFNCNDQFILDVDDITLATGGVKFTRSDRSFMSFNLYRRNNYFEASVADPELIAEGLAGDVFEYIDNEWPTLSFGEWQWGIAATYAGYAPVQNRNRETATFGFEGGLEGWTGIVVNTDGGEWLHSDDNLGGHDYTELAHTGTGFAMCYSFVDYDGAYDTDAYLVSPQKYSVDANSSISFWADNANDTYPENFSVCVSTAANPTASDFVQIWSGGAKGTGNGGAINRRSENRYQNWRSHEISLAEYAGQEIWIAFHDVNYDMYEIWIDDVTINYAGGAPVPPTPGPTGEGISEILWSNVIEKDMEATLTFTSTTNNGQAAAGATIAIVGEENNYTVTLDENGTATQVVRKGEYTMTATLAGYSTTWSFDDEITADAEYNIEFEEIVAPVEDLYVSPTGWAMWEGGTAPGPGPGPQPGGNTSFTEGFEGGLNGWNVLTINAGEGEWIHSDDNLGGYDYTTLAHGGTGFAMCYSYVDYVGAFNTDSYMYTPQKYAIENGSTLTFWADNANDTYPENFSVCVSTANNPSSAADFTQVWSGGAKGTGNGGATVRHQNNRYENWRSHNIDLSAYAGQEVYIAFHDVNYDAYEIWIDDVELSAGSKDRAALRYVVMLDGKLDGETTNPFFQHNVAGLEEGSTHTTAVRPVYMTGNGDWEEFTWVYTSCSNFTGVTELAAEAQGNDVKLTWTMPGGGNPGGGGGGTPGSDESYNFDDNTMMGWTSIDGDGDGNGWVSSANPGIYHNTGVSLSGTGHNSSEAYVISGSYANQTGQALTPNNFLVSPNKAGYSQISFWACAQDASYAAEHYGVAVSTAGNTSAADFTTIAEWTMTAKGEGAMSAGRTRQTRQGSWYQKTVDLSAYAGQDIWIAIRHFNCTDMFILNVDDIELTGASKGNGRDMWDYVTSFTGTSAGQQAVATDGNYIYTASWQSAPTGGHTFYQYNMDGTFVEGFDIAGATGIRDLTTDGEYFYGTSGASQLFILDFTTRTLVGTINCSGLTSRHVSYDPERDGFWSGNWGTLALYSRTGALMQTASVPSSGFSAYGSAYYKDSDNVEHLFMFCQPNSDCKVYDYNITTGSLGSLVLDYTTTTPGCTGIAGGCFIGEYNGNTCWFGNAQQDPNLIAIYELDGTPGPGPGPQPTEGIIGTEIFRDGEWIAFLEGNTAQYIVEGVAAEDATYGVRVVYDGEQVYPGATYYAMSCEETVDYEGDTPACDPVTNLTAEPYNYQGNDGALVSFTEPAGATSYKVYVDGQLLGSMSGQPIFINFEDTPDGDYEIGIVAVYASCESDMATTMFAWDAVAENDVVNAIYPNPTSSDLHINATAMTHVTVYNAMGQMVFDQEVSGDEMILNMGQFESGVYMVKVTTETGSSVKRITVAK